MSAMKGSASTEKGSASTRKNRAHTRNGSWNTRKGSMRTEKAVIAQELCSRSTRKGNRSTGEGSGTRWHVLSDRGVWWARCRTRRCPAARRRRAGLQDRTIPCRPGSPGITKSAAMKQSSVKDCRATCLLCLESLFRIAHRPRGRARARCPAGTGRPATVGRPTPAGSARSQPATLRTTRPGRCTRPGPPATRRRRGCPWRA